jgi:hypothetical protein
MKKLFLIAALLPFFAFQCKKDGNQKCLQGKVIRITCASYVIQVLNNDTVGEDGWKDSMHGQQTTYDNVFNVSNKCKIPASFKVGDTIFFNIDKPEASDCVVCMMYDAPPKTQYQVKNISAAPCEQNQ